MDNHYLTQPITMEQRNELLKLIRRCLTEEIYSNSAHTEGRKRIKSRAIFNYETWQSVCDKIDLDMVLLKVILALSLAMEADHLSLDGTPNG